MRTAVILMYAGVKDVRVLNGGITSWLQRGYTITTDASFPEPVYDFGSNIPANPWIFIDKQQAKQYLEEENKELVCACDRTSHLSDINASGYHDKLGCIPGTVSVNSLHEKYNIPIYRNPDQTTREYHEIERLWEDVGLNPDKHIAFYSNTGWCAAEAWLNAYLMGWENVVVYDGGLNDWSSNHNCEQN